MILGGMVQWLYHAAIMSAGLIAWQVVPRIRRKEPWKKALLSAAGAAALGAALGAAAWLPSIQVTAESTRGESRYYMLDGERESTFHEDHLTHFVTPPFPWEAEADGRLLIHWHEQAMYIGILPLILAAAALIPPRRPIVWFLLAVAAFALLDASAGRIRFEPARWLIPGYATQRIPARSVWMAVFSFSLLAGFGWESLRTTGAATAKRLAWAAAAAIGVGNGRLRRGADPGRHRHGPRRHVGFGAHDDPVEPDRVRLRGPPGRRGSPLFRRARPEGFRPKRL